MSLLVGGMSSEEPSDAESKNRLRSLDEILDLLSNYQRRAILQHLRDNPRSVHSVDELVDHLIEVEQQESGESPEVDQLLSALVHVHGPKLGDAGIVNHDFQNREIQYHPDGRVEELLSRIEETTSLFDDR